MSADKAPTGVARPPRFRISIAAALTLSLTGLVFVGAVAVLALGFGTAAVNTRTLLGDKAVMSIDLVTTEVRQTIDGAVNGNTYLANLIAEGHLDPSDRDRLIDYIRGTMAATPQVLGMGYLSPDYIVTRVARSDRRLGVLITDGRKMPVFVQAIKEASKKKTPFWGPLLRNEQVDATLLNLRTPLWRGDRFLGILVSTVTVSELSRVIARLISREESLVPFVLYDEDHVLAHRIMSKRGFPRSDEYPIPRLDQLGDEFLAQIWRQEVDDDMFVQLKGEVDGHVVRTDGVNHLFFYRRLTQYKGLPVLVGAYVRPESGLPDEIRRLAGAGGVALAIVIVALITSIVLARRLSRPIRQLSLAAQRIGGLQFEDVPTLKRSRLRDLDEAGMAFNVMSSALRWFEIYVPRKLVRSLMTHGGDADIASQERDVTVMFTDIVGFTPLAQSMTATETAALLNDHFLLLAECIEAEDGTLDKYIGDSVMAFWGPPLGDEDHATRACRAALAIRRAIEADNATRRNAGQPPILVRIGLHTGPAIVGNIGAPGRINYTLVGDTVNVTQRLEQLAKHLDLSEGDVKIVLSADVVEALDQASAINGHALSSCGDHELPGRQGAMGVFALK